MSKNNTKIVLMKTLCKNNFSYFSMLGIIKKK